VINVLKQQLAVPIGLDLVLLVVFDAVKRMDSAVINVHADAGVTTRLDGVGA